MCYSCLSFHVSLQNLSIPFSLGKTLLLLLCFNAKIRQSGENCCKEIKMIWEICYFLYVYLNIFIIPKTHLILELKLFFCVLLHWTFCRILFYFILSSSSSYPNLYIEHIEYYTLYPIEYFFVGDVAHDREEHVI